MTEIVIPQKITTKARMLRPENQPKKTLNDIMRDWQTVEDMLIDSGGEFTPEIEEEMEITQAEFEDKLDNYAGFISYLKSQIEFLKKEEDRYKTRRKTLENSILKCKDNIVFAMGYKHIEKLKTPKYSFSIRTTESWQVDEMLVEDEKQLLETGDADYKLKFNIKELKEKYQNNPPKWVKVIRKESINIR